MNTAIIGSGIGGLATAIRLAVKGHSVEVFEANSYPGGKLSSFDLGEYRFDAGPSLFTMPHFIEDLFELAGKDIKNYFDYFKTDKVCHYFWEDGTNITAFAAPEKFAEEVENKLNVKGTTLLKALKDAKRKYDLTAEVFLHRSLHKPLNYLNKETLKGVLAMPTLDMMTSINQVNKRLNNDKLTQLFNRFATYNGSNPYKASGIMTSIPHLEHGFGTFFPKGGMNAITKSLFKLAKELGVQFHFNQKVEEILIRNKQAKGIRIGSEKYDFDAVVSNMDVFFTYEKLLPTAKHPTKILKQPKSSSALIFYWGMEKKFPQLGLHNILFSENYKAEFDHIFNKKTVYDDPTVYINISSKYESSDAPDGCENWFTMINVPANEGQDWDKIIETVRENTIQKVSRMLKTDIRPLIKVEEILEPRTIESKTWSHKGALYGTSSNNLMSAFLRHPNFSRKIKNLYFCGGSVHPGGGIPLCLLSAKIVSDVFED
ncbi:MAG: 1-hydroxycarotenoid 3,4-desaturase CrtD [Saprospiraceae bacterium]